MVFISTLQCQNVIAAVLKTCFVSCSEMFIFFTLGPLTGCTYIYIQAFDHENSILCASLCHMHYTKFFVDDL